jgi:hypothetical protein
MYNKNEKFDQVSAVIFEGPDCCGKSTQVDKFIEKVVKSDQHDVIIKIHFPFDSLGYDLLKNNYYELVNTVYSKEYMENLNNDKLEKLNRILIRNVDFNHIDKMLFISVLKKLLLGKEYDKVIPTTLYELTPTPKYGMSPRQLIENKNCEIWFNGCKMDKTDNDIDVLRMYFEQTEKPNVLLVFDRFIISGIVYNLHLPSAMSDNKLFERITGSLSVAQIHHTESEIDILNSIVSNVLNYEESCFDDRINYCNPKIIWFVFKPSETIYKAFLNDKERKVEEYDTNDILRSTVNDIYTDIVLNKSESRFLLTNQFNIIPVDSDKYIEIYEDKSIDAISSDLYNRYMNNIKVYQSLENNINNYLRDIYK